MKRALVVVAALLLAAGFSGAQEILFDQVVEAGGLKCYPVHGDPASWYYLPDQPHVAMDESGRPQFSFLMYSSPEERGEEGITSSPGGGVAHMLVAYDVPQEMVRRAQSELQRQKPGAVLKGPVGYTDGTFNLVTAVTDPEAGLLRRVVGVGNAPVMSGHKAAVSMHLTPAGAMLLWESFGQRTPDVSVNFEMTVSGYRNPVEAEMTFDYARIHRTIEIEAGIEAKYIEADVDVMLGKMVDNGAIKIELKGAPPEQWAEVQKLGLELAKHHLFEDLGAAPLDQIREATRSRGTTRRSAVEWPPGETIEMVTLPPPTDEEDRQRAREAFDRGVRLHRAERYREALHEFQESQAIRPNIPQVLWAMTSCNLSLGDGGGALETIHLLREVVPGARENADVSEALRLLEGADRPRMTPEQADQVAIVLNRANAALGLDGSAADESGAREQAAEETSAEPDMDFSDQAPESEVPTEESPTSVPGRTPTPAGGEAIPNPFEEGESPSSSAMSETSPGAASEQTTADGERPSAATSATPAPARTPTPRSPASSPKRATSGQQSQSTFALTIAFRYRKIERSGKFTFSMRQWNRVELPVRFAANVGDLSRYMDDARMFKRVSLNDPMFKQREIPVTVDVASEEAFGAMLNAVTVTLRKRHETGRETLDEVTIQRADFSSGKVETLLYGWDGDDDREGWLDYDHRVRWSYVGGPVIEGEWERTNAGALVLEPPLRPRELRLEADPEVLREQGVRDVVVEVRYPAAGVERVATATVRPEDEVGRQVLVLYQDPQSPGYSYSFDWRLYGGRRVTAGPFEDTADYIYLDEIPRE